jgi:leucyl aminopeptidase
MTQFLTKFSSFHTRYFKSESGKKSSQWLFDQLSSLTPKNKNTKFTVEKFQHSWNQFSVIAKWSPVVQETQEIVILSAHQDSVNQWNPWFGRSPGADDDGSGTTTIFEAARVLLNSDFVPRKSIEFHFYSAEEGGLLGSQQVVKHYAQSKKKVVGVLHNDMTGYSPKDKTPVVAISTDNVDPELTKFLGLISNQYSGVPIAFTKCGYACSDHASWTKAKIPSCFTFEAKFEDQSPYIHSTGDTVEQIDFDHMKSFVNNCVGFVVELSLQE